MTMKTLWIVLLAVPSFAAVNVYKSATAPADLETQLVADVTTQYESTVKTGLFGSVNITINKRNQTVPPPPDPELVNLDSIADKLTAISTLTYVYGYAAGMERERGDVIDLTYQMQGDYFANGVLGGTQTYKVVISTNPLTFGGDMVLLSTTTARNEVLRVYNNVVNEISVRYGNVVPIP